MNKYNNSFLKQSIWVQERDLKHNSDIYQVENSPKDFEGKQTLPSLPTTAHLYVIKEAKALTSSTDTSMLYRIPEKESKITHETGLNHSHFKSTHFKSSQLVTKALADIASTD